MRIAIVSDIHGNRTAFEAVLGDLGAMAPDVTLHGGDLAVGGSSPVEIVDWVRDLGWAGVLGNTDEMLARPKSLEGFTGELWDAVREMAAATRSMLGEERVAWLGGLPRVELVGGVGLTHASPGDAWRSPGLGASDSELEAVYRPLGRGVAVFGHIHVGFVRRTPGMLVVNTGSVGLPYDGDRRASYLLLDDGVPVLRRVEYDVEREIRALGECGRPHAEWVGRMLRTAAPQMP